MPPAPDIWTWITIPAIGGYLASGEPSDTLEGIYNQQRADPEPALNAFNTALNDMLTVHLLVRDFDELRGALRPDAQGTGSGSGL